MGWEQFAKKETQLFGVLTVKAMTRWLNAKAQARQNNYDPKQFASDVVSTWADLLDFWWSPWEYASPLLPVLFVQAPPAGNVVLDHDVIAANVSFTACGQVGGNQSIPALDAAGKPNIQFKVVDGCNLVVTGITTVPNAPGLYLGLALEGQTPVATVVVKL